VLIAINCIDKVNPHGKKNVNTPTNGAKTGFLLVSVFSDQLLGRCNPIDVMLGANPSRCNHIQSTTIQTIIVNIVVAVSDIAIFFHIRPSNHPKMKNHPILPTWNSNWAFI
jgi:hypothetical protein